MDPKTVLNVDDHAPARFLRTRILQKAGFGVDEADCAAGAIERAGNASLVLLDVRLPDADGFSVCEQVKKVAPTLPIVSDAIGDIEDLSAEAAKLLNLSARGARGRSLPAFFTDNRTKLMIELLRASGGLNIDRKDTLQPRDRRPVRVHLDVSPLPPKPGEPVQLRWVISPESR